jgi:hypothetical protein
MLSIAVSVVTKVYMVECSIFVVVVDDLPPIAAASMWTRKDVKEFKESLKKDKDSVIKVGSGETVTVSPKFSYHVNSFACCI